MYCIAPPGHSSVATRTAGREHGEQCRELPPWQDEDGERAHNYLPTFSALNV